MEHVVSMIEQTHFKKEYFFEYIYLNIYQKAANAQAVSFIDDYDRKWHYLQVLKRGRERMSANIWHRNKSYCVIIDWL